MPEDEDMQHNLSPPMATVAQLRAQTEHDGLTGVNPAPGHCRGT
jgi:hypothetical protein